MSGTINRSRRSFVWDHFEGNETSHKNKCKYCQYTYEYVPKPGMKHTKPTTAMRFHLINKHKKVDPNKVEKEDNNVEDKDKQQNISQFTCSADSNRTRSLGEWYTILAVYNGHSFHSLTRGPFYSFAF